jgi:hypothetical protein
VIEESENKGQTMSVPPILNIDPSQAKRAQAALRSPTAAAVAGIAFALLNAATTYLIRTAIPADPASGPEWIAENEKNILLALNLIPYSGIAFLWFMGVMRDRFGALEDQFMSTILTGSGLLYLGMLFVGGALTGAILTAFLGFPEESVNSGLFAFARSTTYQILNLYGIRMSAVFMTVSATMWWRTGVMPRWLALLTYPAALVLLLNTTLSQWISLVFAAWVFLVSILVLVLNIRDRRRTSAEGAVAGASGS